MGLYVDTKRAAARSDFADAHAKAALGAEVKALLAEGWTAWDVEPDVVRIALAGVHPGRLRQLRPAWLDERIAEAELAREDEVARQNDESRDVLSRIRRAAARAGVKLPARLLRGVAEAPADMTDAERDWRRTTPLDRARRLVRLGYTDEQLRQYAWASDELIAQARSKT